MARYWSSSESDSPAKADVADEPPAVDHFGFERSPVDPFEFNEPAFFDGPPYFDSTFDPGADGPTGADEPSGAGLTPAPLPQFPFRADLPTRWDALHPEPTDTAFTDTAFTETAFTETAFADTVFEGTADLDHSSRNSVRTQTDSADSGFTDLDSDAGWADFAPSNDHSSFPLDDTIVAAPMAQLPSSLIEDLQKVCRRLTGIGELANALAREAMSSSITSEVPGGDAVTAMSTAVRLCLETPLPNEQKIPFYQHRARLRRDLGRRDDGDRAILAMRHLVGVPPSGVAARLGVAESRVRETSSAWRPADSRVDSLAMLRGIDSWISSDLGSQRTAQTGSELAHLDETM